MSRNGFLALGLLTLSLLAGSAQALLIDNGAAVYDNVTNLSWLKNANLAATDTFGVSGINPDGSMTWTTAQSWIAAMNAANFLGYSDWRLPDTKPINGSTYNYSNLQDGSTDIGYNISAPGTIYAGATGSDLAYMFYNNLTGVPLYNPDGSTNPSSGLLNGSGPFTNAQSAHYWSGTELAIDTTRAWYFNTLIGLQGTASKTNTSYSAYGWAVRTGDTGHVPAPGTVLLLCLGLSGLLMARRRVC